MFARRGSVLSGRISVVGCRPTNFRSHRSATRGDLAVPRTRKVNMCPRSFYVAGPTLWNSLPFELRSYELTLETFKAKLNLSVFDPESNLKCVKSLKRASTPLDQDGGRDVCVIVMKILFQFGYMLLFDWQLRTAHWIWNVRVQASKSGKLHQYLNCDKSRKGSKKFARQREFFVGPFYIIIIIIK